MEKNIPTLRFPEFTGEWITKSISEITEYVDYRGKTPLKTENGVFLVTAKNIRQGYIDYESSKEYVSFEDYEEVMRRGKPKISDVLITTEAPLGNIASIDREDIALAQRVIKYRGKKDLLDNYFLKHNLISPTFQKRLDENSTGSTAKGIKGSVLHKMKLSFPSLPEQTKIANFLTAVDEKISALKKKKELLEQYKKSVMQQIFSQQLRFKDDNGEDFAEWEEKKFSKYIKLYRGSSPRPIIRYITDNEDGVNWIKIGDTKNVENYIIESVSEKITYEGSLQSRKVEIGELILANSMSFGKTYKLNISGCIYDGWFVLREYEKLFNKSFLMQLLNSEFLQKQYKTLSTGGVVQNISSDIVYSTNLLKPSLPEQTKIANFLSAIDEKIRFCGKEIEGMERWKKGLLQQMFV